MCLLAIKALTLFDFHLSNRLIYINVNNLLFYLARLHFSFLIFWILLLSYIRQYTYQKTLFRIMCIPLSIENWNDLKPNRPIHMSKWCYISNSFISVFAIVGEIVLLLGSEDDECDLNALHDHEKENVEGILGDKSFELQCESAMLTDCLTMNGVCRIIFAIKYAWIGSRTKGSIRSISSSKPIVVIRPHYSVSYWV